LSALGRFKVINATFLVPQASSVAGKSTKMLSYESFKPLDVVVDRQRERQLPLLTPLENEEVTPLARQRVVV
jgi:hypothetical protein